MFQAEQNVDYTTFKMIKILNVERVGLINTIDIEVEDDASFTLANGIVSHNSARNSIQSARGKNQLIGSFSLRGKPLNVHDIEPKDIIANNELANILAVTGLQLGEKVETFESPDGEWVELEIDGKIITANANDIISFNGKKIAVNTLL